MKPIAASAIGALVGICVAGAAGATGRRDLTPTDTAFSLKGKLMMEVNSQPLTCNLTLTGKSTFGGTKQLPAGYITGGQSADCKKIKLTNLPWGIGVFDQRIGGFVVMFFNYDGHECEGESTFNTIKSGKWTFTSYSGCPISGKMNSNPPMTIDGN